MDQKLPYAIGQRRQRHWVGQTVTQPKCLLFGQRMGPVHDRAHRLRDSGKGVEIGGRDRFENQREIGAQIKNRFFRRRPMSQEGSKADS